MVIQKDYLIEPASDLTANVRPQDAAASCGQRAAHRAVRRLIRQHHLQGQPAAQLARVLTRAEFAAAGLGSVLRYCYQDSPYHAITAACPVYQTWRHPVVLDDYWEGPASIARALAATTRLIAELGLDHTQPSAVLTAAPQAVFEWYGLSRMLDVIYAGNPVAALRRVLPAIGAWHHLRVPCGYWQGLLGDERARATTRQLLGELGLGGLRGSDVVKHVNRTTFLRHGLKGMLAAVYDHSAYQALVALFSDLAPWEMQRVPLRFWADDGDQHQARRATRWLLIQLGLLGQPPTIIGAAVDRATFVSLGLDGMIQQGYAGSPYLALVAVVPDLRPWHMTRRPRSYWNHPAGPARAAAALRWLLAQYSLSPTDPDRVAACLTRAVLADQGLEAMLDQVYAGNLYHALITVVPDLHPWQIVGGVPADYWEGAAGQQRAATAMGWVLDRLALWNSAAPLLAEQVTPTVMQNWGLGEMLHRCYQNNVALAVCEVRLDLQPWQIGPLPAGYWQGSAGRQRAQAATRWLLACPGVRSARAPEGSLALTAAVFHAWGLGGMLLGVYNNSPYQALADVCPDLLPWQRARTPLGYWQGADGRVHAQAATQWLLDHLELATSSPALIGARVDRHCFGAYGLGGMLQIVYHNSVYQALAAVIPDFHPWQTAGRVPAGYWNGAMGSDRAQQATRWLLRQLDLGDADLCHIVRRVTAITFRVHGLAGMLQYVYHNSPYQALAAVLPLLSTHAEQHSNPDEDSTRL